jgi:spore germination cell wall hydrolase CwlJ-like protein
MFGRLRAGGFAAALLMLVSIAAAPAKAAEAATPAVAQTGSLVLPSTSFTQQPPVEAPATVAAPTSPPVQAATTPAAPPAPATATPPKRRPLRDLVIAFVDYNDRDAEQDCLAKAIYFEARSESLEGQLAVAEVILNRAASGIYPPSICEVVTQPAQFSFIRGGKFPPVNKASEAWRRAIAVADIARKELADAVAPNVLWYHATYVAPSWGRRLTRVAQIGTHIFYN